jgi:hypothetical protein
LSREFFIAIGRILCAPRCHYHQIESRATRNDAVRWRILLPNSARDAGEEFCRGSSKSKTRTLEFSVLTVVAIIVAPIVALNLQRKADGGSGMEKQKTLDFKTLMSNRSTRLNPTFVQALNMIDIEFAAAPEKGQEAWKKLLDHYNV